MPRASRSPRGRRRGRARHLALLGPVVLVSALLSAAEVGARHDPRGKAPWSRRAALRRLPREVQHLLRRLPAAQAAGQRRVAVFDADHTLWNKDVGEQFQKWMMRHRLYPARSQRGVQRAYQDYKRGALPGLEMFKGAVTNMAGMREAKVKRLAARYWQRGFGGFGGQIFAPMKALVGELQRKGVEVYIVSASNPWLVAEGARRLGIDEAHVIGMGVEVKAGRLTDRLVRPIPWESGKVAAIRARLGAVKPVLVAGDSAGDLAMLGLTGQGPSRAWARRDNGPGPRGVSMTVNGHHTPAVQAAARRNGWARAIFNGQDTLAGR